jgi:hypothetical protein
MRRRRASQLIAASEVLADVNHGLQPPANEGQARELVAVPRAERAEVWRRAVETAPNGKATAAHIWRPPVSAAPARARSPRYSAIPLTHAPRPRPLRLGSDVAMGYAVARGESPGARRRP